MARADDELVTAYVDGVSELDADARRRVEQLLRDDPEARADADATRELLARVRGLPAEGVEPDWTALEHEIRRAVGPRGRPTRWWRVLVPAGAIVLAAAAALALWLRPAATEHAATARRESPAAAHPAAAPTPVLGIAATAHPRPRREAATGDDSDAIWIGDSIIDLSQVDPSAIPDDFDRDARAALANDGEATGGILPVDDLGWVDQLDARSVARAERYLARKPG